MSHKTRTFRVLPRTPHTAAEPDRPPAATADPGCPIANCTRCGYEFPPHTVAAVCPRCLEPFSRESCFGSCWECGKTVKR